MSLLGVSITLIYVNYVWKKIGIFSYLVDGVK